MTDEHADRLHSAESKHIASTISRMAEDLRRTAEALDRIAADDRYEDATRASFAWSELRGMNSNLRVDILISSLGRQIEIPAAEQA